MLFLTFSGPRDLGRKVRRLHAELFCILGIQTRPIELHRFAANDSPEGLAGEESIEHIDADVPAGRTHRYETTIDVVPEREARAVAEWLELPSDIVVAPSIFEQLWGVSARHTRLGDHRSEERRVGK